MRRRAFLAGAATAAVAGCVSDNSDEIGTLEARLDAKNDTIDALESELDQTESELASVEDELDEQRVEVADYETRVDILETQLSDTEDELEATEEEREAIQARIEAIKPETTIPDDEIEQAAAAARDVRAAVAYVYSSYGLGTAFQVERGTWVTAAHVVESSGYHVWPVTDLDLISGRSLDFDRGESYDDLDARILETTGSASTSVPLGSVDDVSDGDTIFAVGNPYNVGYWITSVGKFRGSERETFGLDELYRADCPARRRSSGSPVFNLDGECIGLVVVELAPHDGYDAPDEPFFNFAEYDPDMGFVSIDSIERRLL